MIAENYSTVHCCWKMKKIFIISCLFTAISTVYCQNRPNIEPDHVERNEGESANIMCSFGRPVERCRFITPFGNNLKIRETGEIAGKYSYYGTGFANGQCGIKISNLDKNDEGQWRCSLDVGGDYDDIEGTFNVTITRSPQKLELYIQDANSLRDGTEVNAECTFRDGIPPASISWYLADERVQPRDPTYNEDRTGEILVTSIFQRTLRAGDNLKPLICRIDHPALQDGFMNTTHQLYVNFQPQALSRQELYISGLTIGNRADIEVFLRANPKPRLQWTIDGKTLKEGTQDNKYVVNSAVLMADGRYSAKLTIIELTLQDTTKVYNLRADNEYGATDYPIRIGGSPDENGKT